MMNLFNKAVSKGEDEPAAALCVIIHSQMGVSALLQGRPRRVDAKFIGGAFALALKAARS